MQDTLLYSRNCDLSVSIARPQHPPLPPPSCSSLFLVREDLLKKMQRHTIVPLMTSDDAPEITEQIVQSILDQVSGISLFTSHS
jgi:hypothetical protein